ncbi:uncharacterized protein N0V89_011994 [Didymosphaeria variabile]|uniref:F-box domain-containing protein n=1 Tax=Didymosphaeria variabile TaxID=1932322 RepID=A0A9W9C699_9PLEO|nr:uncharacterized protein N0V89_011994 [Didymosphaeria variabile]KAJ4345859.1 hypothetical protein N0V89_011994 [Didymosphaeria variabile]
MALAALPCELLDIIIVYSLPSSFENLATTCKRIYARCTPFIKRHNELRYRFQDFYYDYERDSLVAASDLISLIAADPIVAQYIHTANLVHDSKFLRHARARGKPPKSVPSIEGGGAIVQLFANSTYLQRARLDWREHYTTFAEDVREMRYSQHGSVFLLTLLGYTENLTIPGSWKQNATTTRLLDVIVMEARKPNFQPSSPGLRRLTAFHGEYSTSETNDWGMDWDICKFINAVARKAGSHLEEFSVTLHESGGSILPGKASTRGFKKLKKFELPLKVVTCNLNAAGVTGNIATSLQRLIASDPFIRDLIPTSVRHLSIKSEGLGPYDKGLDALFGRFRAVRRSQLPNLQELHIACKQEADNTYKQQCNKIVAEGKREGVIVHLEAYEYSGGINWDE